MEIIKAKNLKDALKLRTEKKFPILAGGTDILVQMRASRNFPKGMICISGVRELKKISLKNNKIEIGAGATHSEVALNKLVQKYLPALTDACKTVGARQIQNRGTIGGNVMNASPAGDTLPVLLAFDAEVVLQSVRGKRIVPFTKFYKGYRSIDARSDEILTAIIIKKPAPKTHAVFMKIGTRRAQAISKVCACFVRAGDKFAIAYGSVAATPVRCKRVEEFLNGKKISAAIVAEALELLNEDIQPIEDIRSSAEYRSHVSKVLLDRFQRILATF